MNSTPFISLEQQAIFVREQNLFLKKYTNNTFNHNKCTDCINFIEMLKLIERKNPIKSENKTKECIITNLINNFIT